MHQHFIQLSEDSYIEVTTRLYDSTERIVVALRGTKDSSIPALASVTLNSKEVQSLVKSLQEILHKIEVEQEK